MTKTKLNDKLAELYGLAGTHKRISGIDIIEGNIYAYDLLIDDWSSLMDLAVDNGLPIYYSNAVFNLEDSVWTFVGKDIIKANFKDHESPQAATRFVIAIALVKLKDGKFDD